MFNEIKNRDAWSTIRGFVYQIDITILRWLELNDNDLLELEKGEDIDIIRQNLEKSPTNPERELEQIKVREVNLTLNSDEILESILNYFVHRKNNSSIKLLFRFITNTLYGKERPALFIGGESGIEIWIKLKNKELLDPDEYLSKIKTHLIAKVNKIITDWRNDNKEQDSLANWKDLFNFLKGSTESEFSEFVFGLEWSFKNENTILISETIKNKLLDKGHVNDLGEGNQLYSKLFLFVFKLLSRKTAKQLSKQDLKDQISSQTINSADQSLSVFLDKLVKEIENRITALEKNVETNTADIASLFNQIGDYSKTDAVFNYNLSNLASNPPSLILRGSLRKEKVDQLFSAFKINSWIALQGIRGTGKSQLALLVSKKFRQSWWIELRPYNNDEERSKAIIETFLTMISNIKPMPNRHIWLDKVILAIPDNSIIIFNDIPKITENSNLNELLILLSSSLANKGIKLLTTSNYAVSNILKGSLLENVLLEDNNLNFSDSEIREYFVNNEAPDAVLNFIHLISTISNRNPRLVSAILYHLKAIDWGKGSSEVFDAVLNKEFAKDIIASEQLSINKYITDPKTRELLYRLSLIYWSFDLAEVKSVCQVKEPIEHSFERLLELNNIWIQQQDNGTYQVSPLIRDIAKHNLAEDVIQNTHLALGRAILSRKKLNPINASQAITQFTQGKDFNQAGSILILALNSAKTSEDIKEVQSWGYLSYWKDTELPKEMSVFVKVMLRAAQIRILDKLNIDSDGYKKQVINCLNEPNLDTIELLIINVFSCNYIVNIDLSKFWEFFRNAIVALKALKQPYKKVFEPKHFTSLLWVPIPKIISTDDINNWLKSIKLVEDELKVNFFNHKIAQASVTILGDNIVQQQNKKAETDRDWNEAIARLEILIVYFKNRKQEILEAIILKEILASEFHGLKDKRRAIKRANVALKAFSIDEAKYLIYENIGKLFYNDKDISNSIEWLSKALEIDCIGQTSYIDTLIYSASAFSKINSLKSIEYCIKAIKIADSRKKYNELDYILLLGELAISYWIEKKYNQSFEYFEKVVSRLFESKKENYNERWIWLFKITGHVLLFISSRMKGETPRMSDGVDFFEPYQGVYFFSNKNLSNLYNPINDPIILAILASFAEGIGDINKAYLWTLKAFDLSRKNGNEKVVVMISAICNQYALINFKIEEAFESCLLFAAISTRLKGSTREKYERSDNIKFTEILDKKPSADWNSAEDIAVLHSIIPMIIILLTDQLQNSEEKDNRFNSFLNMLVGYEINASNPTQFSVVEELSRKIIKKEITEKLLTERANNFGEFKKKNEQLICILGAIFISKNTDQIITQMINVIPYLTKVFSTSSENCVLKYVIGPFVKEVSIKLLNENFVGNKNDLELIKLTLEQIGNKDKYAIQLILQIVVKEFEIKVLGDRKLWLYEYKEI